MTLDQLLIGKSATITHVGGSGALRRHLLDMGLTPNTPVTLRKTAPMGDPIELDLRGYSLTLRLDDAKNISITNPHPLQKINYQCDVNPSIPHPKHGETCSKKNKVAGIPEDASIVFALAGNQNCGKTTLFNQLTGSNQHVGNFPGVTVDRKDGQIRKHPEATVVDLPGIYSLSPYSSEEIVTRDFLLKNKPDAIINIVDTTNIERNLYLTMQLIELDIPMVLALNMMDEMRANHNTIHINYLEAQLGIPVVPISAAKNEGIDELIAHALQVARFQEKPLQQDFCSGAVHRCIHGIVHLIEDHAQQSNIPYRFAVTKLLEGDPLIEQQLSLSQNEKELIQHAVTELEQECNSDKHSILADMRYSFIQKLCNCSVVRQGESKEKARSLKADNILTHKIWAIPIFLGIMALVFWLTFGAVGSTLSDWFSLGIDSLTPRFYCPRV